MGRLFDQCGLHAGRGWDPDRYAPVPVVVIREYSEDSLWSEKCRLAVGNLLDCAGIELQTLRTRSSCLWRSSFGADPTSGEVRVLAIGLSSRSCGYGHL